MAKAVTKDVGMATITINEFLKLRRNKSITNETKITAKIKSKTTELTAAIVQSQKHLGGWKKDEYA